MKFLNYLLLLYIIRVLSELPNHQIFDISNVVNCLRNKNCWDPNLHIVNFMRSFRLWNKDTYSLEILERNILEIYPSFPNDVIRILYKEIKTDFSKELEISSFRSSLQTIKASPGVMNRIKGYNLNTINKYANRQDLKNPTFLYKSINVLKVEFSNDDKKLIQNELKILIEQVKKSLNDLSRQLNQETNSNQYEIKKKSLKLVELLSIEEDDKIETLLDFRNVMNKKFPSHGLDLTNMHQILLNIITKQRSAVDEFAQFINNYEKTSYIQAWYFIEKFVDAFCADEYTEFELDELSVIFFRKFIDLPVERTRVVQNLVSSHAQNYAKVKARAYIVDSLKVEVNIGRKIFFHSMYEILISGGIDVTITDYRNFKKICKDINIGFIEEEIQLIYPFYIDFIEFHKRTTNLNKLFNKLKINSVGFMEIFSLLFKIVDDYQIHGIDITFEQFLNKVLEKDGSVNENSLQEIYPFITKYILFGSRLKEKELLNQLQNEISSIDCYSRWIYLERSMESFKIPQNVDVNIQIIEKHLREIFENVISDMEVEKISQLFLKCRKYIHRKKLIQNLITHIDSAAVKYGHIVVHADSIIYEYNILPNDLNNFANFMKIFKNLDEIVIISELKYIYPYIIEYSKYKSRRMYRQRFTSLISKASPKIWDLIEPIEDFISIHDLKINELFDFPKVEKSIRSLDKLVEDKEIKKILQYLVKYKNYIKRRQLFDNLFTYIKNKVKISDFYLSVSFNQMIEEYDLLEHDISTLKKFVTVIERYDDYIYRKEFNKLYEIMVKYLNLHQRKTQFDAFKSFYQNNKENKYLYKSNIVKKYVSLYKLMSKNSNSFREYIELVQSMDKIYCEKHLKQLYPIILNHISKQKIFMNMNTIQKFVKNDKSFSYVRLYLWNLELLKYYKFEEENVNDIFSIFSFMKETDFFDERQIAVIYPKLKFSFFTERRKNILNMFIINIFENHENSSLVKEKSLDALMKSFTFLESSVSNFFDYDEIIKKLMYMPLEIESLQTYSYVIKRLTFYQSQGINNLI